jgi:CBS domain-containing protein
MANNLRVLMKYDLTALTEIPVAFKCTPSTTLRTAINTLQGAKIGCLIVADGFNVMGIFTERDLLLKVVGKNLDIDREMVGTFMTKKPKTVPRETTIAEALRMMVKNNFRHLVVADSHSSIIQVISMRDLCQYIMQAYDKDTLILDDEAA